MTDDIRLLLVDDDAIVRNALAVILNAQDGLAIAGTAANGLEALQILDQQPIDLALVDINMPLLDGVQTAEQIILSHPEVVVVMLTAFEQDDYLSRALTLDIGGFLTKDMSGEQLGESIKQAYCGQKVFGPQPTSVLIESYRSVASAASEFAEFKDAVEKLPDYLRHVFDLLITGLPYKSIARRLSLSDTTVRSYISDIYSATGFTNRAELTIVAIRAGF